MSNEDLIIHDDLTEKLDAAQDALYEERQMVDQLITVLNKYMDTIDPDENEWVAGNWQLRKSRMMRQYEELIRSRSYMRTQYDV